MGGGVLGAYDNALPDVVHMALFSDASGTGAAAAALFAHVAAHSVLTNADFVIA
jgi:hypothetical protein